MRKAVFDFISVNGEKNQSKDYYDPIMMVTILISLIPLMFKAPPPYAIFLERATTGIFILDYILRLWTADLYMEQGKNLLSATPLLF